jgi:hypothetical protein
LATTFALVIAVPYCQSPEKGGGQPKVEGILVIVEQEDFAKVLLQILYCWNTLKDISDYSKPQTSKVQGEGFMTKCIHQHSEKMSVWGGK